MEPTDERPLLEPAESGPAQVGELVVQNGRLQGARRALANPLTLIGRAEGCDVRVNVDQVSPLHCAIVVGADGLILRDLKSEHGTRVNDARVASCPLRHGDVIAVGPCRFRVRVSSARLTPPLRDAQGGDGSGNSEAAPVSPELLRQEQEALRIQAAAVAAQQAGLIDEEARLQERRTALEQQETELAAHLEDKRCRLIELRDKVQRVRVDLQAERQAHDRHVVEATSRLEAVRAEVADGQFQNQNQRQRLLRLQQHLKRRWHRQWTREREAMRQRERDLADEAGKLERAKQRLQHERETLNQWRLRCNGEAELDRRELQAGWELLERERAGLQEQLAGLGEREAALAAGTRRLADQKRTWEERRRDLCREAEGLEARIANHRCKIADQEKEAAGLTALVQELQDRASQRASTPPAGLPPAPESGIGALSLEQHAWELRNAEATLRERCASLDALAGELADQRLHLTEQCRRLAQARRQWQADHDAATAELEAVARRLQQRERDLEGAEARCRQSQEEIVHERQYLESRQAQLTARAIAWEGERERDLADLRTREESAQRRLEIAGDLRRLWHQRYQQGLARLQAEYAACRSLHEEFTVLRQHWLRRTAVLQEKQRNLAARAMSVEQFRQEMLRQAPDARQAEKGVERLRRRWTSLSAALARKLARERQTLEKESAQLAERYRQIHRWIEEIANREESLAARETAGEQQRGRADIEAAKVRQEIHRLSAQRVVYERQVTELREEAERLAHLLIGEDPGSNAIGQAA
jgi:chromosome segregation ATPase